MTTADPLAVTAIEPSGNLYGSEFCLLDVIRGTAARGLDWEVILPGGGGFDRLLESEGVRAHRLLPDQMHRRPTYEKLVPFWNVRRHLARRRPSVLYLNQAGMLRSLNALSRGLRLPIVCQVQTLEDARYVARHPRTHDTVQAFVFNSHFTASHARVAPEKRCVFYQGVEPRVVPAPPAPPAPGELWKIGILGRIAVSKGHYVLLDAMAELVARGTRDLRVVVIGKGITPEHTDRYHQAVERAGLSRYFEFRGYRSDVSAELARVHALAIPSLAEPLGRVLLDACAAGVPVLVSDSGGLGEFSRALDIGRRVPAGDSAALAAGMRRFLEEYVEEAARFHQAAIRLFERLVPGPYIDAMMAVIRNAAEGEPTATEWLGAAR